MVSVVNSHTNATLKRKVASGEVDMRFALNSTPGWFAGMKPGIERRGALLLDQLRVLF